MTGGKSLLHQRRPHLLRTLTSLYPNYLIVGLLNRLSLDISAVAVVERCPSCL